MLGAEGVAYTPIVASGADACTIHYSRNDKQLKSGSLIKMDAGCELHGGCWHFEQNVGSEKHQTMSSHCMPSCCKLRCARKGVQWPQHCASMCRLQQRHHAVLASQRLLCTAAARHL